MDRVVCDRVRQPEVLDRLQRRRVAEHGGRLDAGHPGDRDVALRDEHERLVQGGPERDLVAELPGRVGGVLAELLDGAAVEPARPLQSLGHRIVGAAPVERRAHRERVVRPAREREVVQRQHHLHAALVRGPEDPQVAPYGRPLRRPVELPQLPAGDALARLDPRGRAGEDPAPLDPEADRVVVELLARAAQVPLPLVPEPGTVGDRVAADDPVGDQPGIRRELVPVAAAIDVGRRAAGLALKAGGGGAPEEVARERLGRARGRGRRQRKHDGRGDELGDSPNHGQQPSPPTA